MKKKYYSKNKVIGGELVKQLALEWKSKIKQGM